VGRVAFVISAPPRGGGRARPRHRRTALRARTATGSGPGAGVRIAAGVTAAAAIGIGAGTPLGPSPAPTPEHPPHTDSGRAANLSQAADLDRCPFPQCCSVRTPPVTDGVPPCGAAMLTTRLRSPLRRRASAGPPRTFRAARAHRRRDATRRGAGRVAGTAPRNLELRIATQRRGPHTVPPTGANAGPARASRRRDAHQPSRIADAPPRPRAPAPTRADTGPTRPDPRAPEAHPLCTSPPPTIPTRTYASSTTTPSRKPAPQPPPTRSTHPSSAPAAPPHPHPHGRCFRPGPTLARPVAFRSTLRPRAPDLHIQAPRRGRRPQHPSPRGRTASHQFLSESLTRSEALRTLCQQALT
jgi:hypothetical protein